MMDEYIDNLAALVLVVAMFVVERSVHAVDYTRFNAERTVIHLQYYY